MEYNHRCLVDIFLLLLFVFILKMRYNVVVIIYLFFSSFLLFCGKFTPLLKVGGFLVVRTHCFDWGYWHERLSILKLLSYSSKR